jgi:outer membrane protein, adhesin transport system
MRKFVDSILNWVGLCLLAAGSPLLLATEQETSLLSLHAAVVLAVDHYPDLAAKRFDLRASGYELAAAKWQLLPSLRYSYEDVNGGVNQGVTTLQQPIFTFGKLRNKVAIATAGFGQAQHDLNELRLQLALKVSLEFFSVVSEVERLAISSENVSAHNRLFQMIARRVEAEASADADSTLARARLDAALSEKMQIEQNLHLANLRLASLIGTSFDGVAFPLKKSAWRMQEEQVIKAAIAAAPSLAILEAQKRSAKAKVFLAEGEMYPDIHLKFEDRKGDTNFFNPEKQRIFVEFSLDTGAGLSKKATLNAARQRVFAWEQRILGERQRLDGEVAALYQNHQAAVARAPLLDSLVAATDAVVSSYIRQYTVGRKSWLDVMNAQREWAASKHERVENLISMNLHMIYLEIRSDKFFDGSSSIETE